MPGQLQSPESLSARLVKSQHYLRACTAAFISWPSPSAMAEVHRAMEAVQLAWMEAQGPGANPPVEPQAQPVTTLLEKFEDMSRQPVPAPGFSKADSSVRLVPRHPA
jgi:hypothetical protein